MSRKTSPGSRFAALPIEGEEDDSGSDSSVQEMKLSRDFYPANIAPHQRSVGSHRSSQSSVGEMQLSRDFYQATIPPPQNVAPVETTDPYQAPTPADQGSRRSQTSDSSVEEMKLSRDYYPTEVPITDMLVADLGRYLPEEQGPSTSGLQATSQQRQIKARPMRPIPETTEESSGLQFVWDHYRRESQPYDVVGVDALDQMFGVESDTSSEPDISENIQQDVNVLKGVGFNIDYPKGMLGEGFYGVVYRGTYGEDVPDIGSNRFAVKIIEFGNRNDPEVWDRRERFETEKFILTTATHRNIVSIRMIINMGNIRSFPFKGNMKNKFLSPDRVYLIMDFADGGELESWINKNYKTIDPATRINFIRDLFFGMLYLHSHEIVHGDVHTGNVLIFNEKDGVVAKWSDFGLGFVGSDKQYRFRIAQPKDMKLQYRLDVAGMYSVFWTIMRDRHQCRPETPEEKKLMDEVLAMLRILRESTTTYLTEVQKQFKHILEDELTLEESHFQ